MFYFGFALLFTIIGLSIIIFSIIMIINLIIVFEGVFVSGIYTYTLILLFGLFFLYLGSNYRNKYKLNKKTNITQELKVLLNNDKKKDKKRIFNGIFFILWVFNLYFAYFYLIFGGSSRYTLLAYVLFVMVCSFPVYVLYMLGILLLKYYNKIHKK